MDVVMPVYNIIENNDDYSRICGSLWHYDSDKPNDDAKNSESFKSKAKITGKIRNDSNTTNIEMNVPLKYLGNFSGLL